MFKFIANLFKSSAKKATPLIAKKSNLDEALHYFNEAKSLNEKKKYKEAFQKNKKAIYYVEKADAEHKNSKEIKDLLDKATRLLDEILNNFMLDDLLAKAKEKEKKSLAEVLEVSLDDDKTGNAPQILQEFNSLVRSKGYRDVLCDCAEMMKIALDGDETIVEIETRILETAYERFRDDFKKASHEDQNKLLASINEKYEKQGNLTRETLATASILTINSLGFAPYLAATTTLGALSSVIGITLPFAVYTTTTSFISIITGPVGWTVLSVLVIRKIIRWWRDKKKIKIISCIVIIALMRYRLKYERVSDAEI